MEQGGIAGAFSRYVANNKNYARAVANNKPCIGITYYITYSPDVPSGKKMDKKARPSVLGQSVLLTCFVDLQSPVKFFQRLRIEKNASTHSETNLNVY